MLVYHNVERRTERYSDIPFLLYPYPFAVHSTGPLFCFFSFFLSFSVRFWPSCGEKKKIHIYIRSLLCYTLPLRAIEMFSSLLRIAIYINIGLKWMDLRGYIPFVIESFFFLSKRLYIAQCQRYLLHRSAPLRQSPPPSRLSETRTRRIVRIGFLKRYKSRITDTCVDFGKFCKLNNLVASTAVQ